MKRSRQAPWEIRPNANDEVIAPFWTPSTAEHSEQAWVPPPQAPRRCDTGSWFTRTELAAGVSDPPEWKDAGGCAAPPKQKRKKFSSEMVDVVEVRARKILLKPTPEQAQILRRWFDGARFAYNHALELCEAVPEARSLQSLRSYVVATDLLPPEWAYSPSFFSY